MWYIYNKTKNYNETKHKPEYRQKILKFSTLNSQLSTEKCTGHLNLHQN